MGFTVPIIDSKRCSTSTYIYIVLRITEEDIKYKHIYENIGRKKIKI